MTLTERLIGSWIGVAHVDIEPTVTHIEPVVTHIEPSVEPTMTMLVTRCSEPLVVSTIVALDISYSKPLVVTTLVSSASIDILSVLASLALYFMPSKEQLRLASTELPLTIESLAMATKAGPSGLAGGSSSPNSEDSAESEIHILVESLMKLFTQIVESALTTEKDLSSCTKKLLWSQLDLHASVPGAECVGPYKEMIDQAELYFLELQHLHEADITDIVELEFHHLTVECCKLEEAARREVEEVNLRLQELTIHLTEIDGENTKITINIFEREATINRAKAIIVEA